MAWQVERLTPLKKMFVKGKHTCTRWFTLGGVGTFAKEAVLELMLINLVNLERLFCVLRTLGWLLEWNTAFIHLELD